MPNYKTIAISAAKQAGKYFLDNFHHDRREKAIFKNKHEIATAADLGAEKIILGLIKKNFPDHEILSEEAGDNRQKSDYLWVIDPLDGTTNYSMQNPLFSVSIALFYRNEPILGVIYAPALQELYIAEKGRGAMLNSKKIHVSQISDIHKSLITFCHGHRLNDIKRATKSYVYFKLRGFDTRQLGSAALELGFVAAGRTESIMIPGAHPWDVAAGILIIREAHGRVTDYTGKEWHFKSKDMLASNGKIHQGLLKFLKKI